MADYPTVLHFELPPEYVSVWDDINNTKWQPEKAEAVVVFAGLLDHDVGQISWPRWQRALAPFCNRFIAGIHAEDGQAAMRELSVNHPGWATWQINAQMTPEQAVWTVAQMQANRLNSVALYVWKGHLNRAAMTLAKAAQDAGWKGKIYPFGWHPGDDPLDLAGFDNHPRHDDLVPGEQSRLVNYTRQGHVALPETWSDFRPND